MHISKYTKHIFICINERPQGHPRPSCGRCGGSEIRLRFLELIQEHGLKGQVRANKSQCLDACELGPAVVIYPAGVWYTQVRLEDVDRIFNASVLQDTVVDELAASKETWEKLRKLRQATDTVAAKGNR